MCYKSRPRSEDRTGRRSDKENEMEERQLDKMLGTQLGREEFTENIHTNTHKGACCLKYMIFQADSIKVRCQRLFPYSEFKMFLVCPSSLFIKLFVVMIDQ